MGDRGDARAGSLGERRRTRQVRIGPVPIGGDAPIAVQSMTCTKTADVAATLAQVRALADAAAALRAIVGGSPVPLVADIHFDYRLALAAVDAGIHALRLNPGNIGARGRVREVVRAAAARRVPIRIGVNAGSLEKEILARHGWPTA